MCTVQCTVVHCKVGRSDTESMERGAGNKGLVWKSSVGKEFTETSFTWHFHKIFVERGGRSRLGTSLNPPLHCIIVCMNMSYFEINDCS
jgi:hypothetical protein